jgi:hypothetical protein
MSTKERAGIICMARDLTCDVVSNTAAIPSDGAHNVSPALGSFAEKFSPSG